jgi:hypothetical protein|tara:strand:+ start:118 stop:564 length:447 start_codon:yes stop_codon:yes gene_type:complete
MGLDMYLQGKLYHHGMKYDKNGKYTERKREKVDGYEKTTTEIEIAYWRKHPNLHGYIVKTFNNGEDDCTPIDLSPDNLDQIANAIEKNELPETTGFFFGESSWHEEDKEKNVEIFRKASKWLRSKWDGENKYSNKQKDWVSVQYLASW